MEDVLNDLSDQDKPQIPRVSRRRNGFSRDDVVSAFVSAFEVIGGVNRLALWANANPDKFYPLYSKLLPATTQLLGHTGPLEIIHRIAPTALDRHDDVVDEASFEDVACRELSSATPHDLILEPSTPEIKDGAFSLRTDEQEKPSPPSMI